jgi:hypothetical protein
MLHFLRFSQFQLRLGWLSVAAVCLGHPALLRLERDELAAVLLEAAARTEAGKDAQTLWLEHAGLSEAPTGRISPRAQIDIARMAESYGVYDSQTQTLTDLGHVLLAVEPWRNHRDDPSPFAWVGAKRFIGLHLVLAANGDMVLAFLRRLPDSGLLAGDDALSLLADCASELLGSATGDEEREELTRYVERLRSVAVGNAGETKDPRYLRSQYIYPVLEPLRDLGYLAPGPQVGDYVLTDAGRKLKAALRPTDTTESLLVNELSLRFLTAEGALSEQLEPADGLDLVDTLRDLPGALHAGAADAPLEPVVLLTQARLINQASARWIDVASVIELLSTLESTSKGLIWLKPATGGGRYNISWTSPKVLQKPELWSGQRGSSSKRTPAESAPVNVLLQENRVSLVQVLHARVAQSAAPRGELHIKIWLKYVFELLDAPAPGGVACTSFGGPHAWIDTLIKYLEHPQVRAKRSPQEELVRGAADTEPKKGSGGGRAGRNLASAPLEQWLSAMSRCQLQSTEPIARCTRLWADDGAASVSRVRGELMWAKEALTDLSRELVELIHGFLSKPAETVSPEDWHPAREATRALVEDAVHRGYFRRDELEDRLKAYLAQASAGELTKLEVASRWLRDLTTLPPEQRYVYDQEFQVPVWLSQTLAELDQGQRSLTFNTTEVELSHTRSSEDDASSALRTITVTIDLSARTPVQGHSRGKEYAEDAISRLRFLALLRHAGAMHVSSTERTIEPGTVRFRLPNGALWEPGAARQAEDLAMELWRPDLLNFVRGAQVLRACPVQTLPGLSAIDRGPLLDARARLTRALHWLSIAEDRAERPGERLSHAWVALEHLVTDGGESKLPIVLEVVPEAVALCFAHAFFGTVYRDALAALHLLACKNANDAGVAGAVSEWLGERALAWYLSRPSVAGPFKEERTIEDDVAVDVLCSRWSRMEELAVLLEPSAPFAAFRLRQVAKMISDRATLRSELQRFRIEAACLLSQVYDVRNQLVHDADPFGFDDAYRLHVLYDRYRSLVDPVVAEVLRRVADSPRAPLSHTWSLLRARFEELCDREIGMRGFQERRIIACLKG